MFEVRRQKLTKQLKYWSNHIPADSQLSRTHRAHCSRTVRPPGTQGFDPVTVNLPVQHCQHSLTGLWLPLEPTQEANWWCALLLLACFFPFLENRFILQDGPSHNENCNTVEDEDTHNRIFNTELHGIIFPCRVTSAALFLRQLETIKIRIASTETLRFSRAWAPHLSQDCCHTAALLHQTAWWLSSGLQPPSLQPMSHFPSSQLHSNGLCLNFKICYCCQLWITRLKSPVMPKNKITLWQYSKKKDWIMWAGTQCCLKSVVLHCFDISNWETGHLDY